MLKTAFLVALLACLMYLVFNIYLKLGLAKHFYKHHPGECRMVKGADFGSEDMELTSDGLAFITSGVHYIPLSSEYKAFYKDNGITGRILIFDFNKPNVGAKEIKIKPTKDLDLSIFRPHGISMLEDKVKGEHLLYVINHAGNLTDRVEKFRFSLKSQELIHIKSIHLSEEITITNDLAVTGEDQFYISNFQYFYNPFLSMIENSIPYGLGGLFYFDGKKFKAVAPNLHAPNGVTLSKDKRFLYLDMPTAENVMVYERKKDNSLVLVQTVPVYSAVDNLQLNLAGDTLYIGAHPIAHKVVAHLGDPNNRAPSSVLRLPLKNGKIVEDDITELFYDHGDLISGSTVANVYNNQLLIGSIIDKLVLCDGNQKF